MKIRNNRCISRRPPLAFCFLILSFALYSADNGKMLTCTPVKNILTGKISVDDQAESFISPPFFYYITKDEWNSKKRELKILMINSNTLKKDSFILDIPKIIVINHLPEIVLNEDYLILTDDNNSENYRFKNNGKTYRFMNKILLPEHAIFDRVKILKKNKFLLSSLYNYHPDEKRYNANLGIYDAEKDSLINFIHPDLPCIGFSHLMNSWITASDRLIGLANPCGYKIIFYDLNLHPIDSIDFTPISGWKNPDGNKIPFETSPTKINLKLLIDKLVLLQDTISRIEQIFFINNSTLLVSSSGNNLSANERRIDLWKTNQLNKPYYTAEKFKINYLEEDSILLNNIPLFLNSSLNIEIQNDLIYSFNSEDYIPVKNNTVKDFNHLKDLYYENNNPQFTFNICKINIP